MRDGIKSPASIKIYFSCVLFSFFLNNRAYADAGPSVQHPEQTAGEEADFARDSEKMVESSSGDEGAQDEGEEGKKKKPRSGFRDRKVINKLSACSCSVTH